MLISFSFKMEMQNPKNNNLLIAICALDKHYKLTLLFFLLKIDIINFEGELSGQDRNRNTILRYNF